MRKSYDKADYGAATRYADILLRTRPQLIRASCSDTGSDCRKQECKWRSERTACSQPTLATAVFSHISRPAISDARTPIDLLLSLKETANPPTAADLLGYLNFLISHKFHELAYYTWLQFLPLDQLGNAGLLFNGSFEAKPSGSPFDWVMASGSGVTIDIAAAPDRDGERALRIEFGHGRVDFRGVTQLIMASPGTYKFQGRYLGSIMGRRGLRWRVTCANAAATQIGESPMVIGASSTMEGFRILFHRSDKLSAAATRTTRSRRTLESEQFVSGLIWYDDLRIVRVE